MKKKIAILGSTGSIGKNLIDIIKKDKKNIKIILLTTNTNCSELFRQAKYFKVRHLIITNKKKFDFFKKKESKYLIYNNFDHLDKIFKNKIDYVMSAITGLAGLDPTIKIIKYTNKIAIANKESIVCGWNLIKKKLSKYKTKFVPVDSEHFSLWFGAGNKLELNVDKIFLTASGGPFLGMQKKKLKKANIEQALNHPKWKMGKKISVDSATMINKVFEVIEAKNIFNIPYKKISILIHRESYIHSIIKFSNGLIKLIAHDTTMKIPIFNTLYNESNNTIKSKDLNLKKLNDLDFLTVNQSKFPIQKILKNLPDKTSLFETVLVSANDQLVELFLNNKIKFHDITNKLIIFMKKKEFLSYKKLEPKNILDIIKLSSYVKQKINDIYQ